MNEQQSSLEWHSTEFYQTVHVVGCQRVSFVQHAGKRILTVNFSHAELDLVKATAAEYLHVLKTEPVNSVLSLIEVEGIPFSPEALKVGGELTEMGEPYSLRTAICGVTGFRSFILQTLLKATRRPAALFKERSEALAWLLLAGDSQ